MLELACIIDDDGRLTDFNVHSSSMIIMMISMDTRCNTLCAVTRSSEMVTNLTLMNKITLQKLCRRFLQTVNHFKVCISVAMCLDGLNEWWRSDKESKLTSLCSKEPCR